MSAQFDTPRLLVGLGNPGRKYLRTRHNVGFMVMDALAAREGVAFSSVKKWEAEVARAPGMELVKPQTFMNLSGQSVGAIAHFYKIEPAQCLVVYDDTALPFGRMRIRPGGSAGGHNGMKSLIQHLGTDRFPRIRIGIGSASHGTSAAHVLGKFTEDEESELERSIETAVESIGYTRTNGLEKAMAFYNRPPETQKTTQKKSVEEGNQSADPKDRKTT